MSGFEVAGAVLGGIPLIISALEHYQQGISTIRTWRNYNRELSNLIRNLETERVRLQDACEKLLVGLVPASQIESMVNDPFGPAWHEEEVRVKISRRLSRSDNVFLHTIEDMGVAIEEMMQRLDLQPDGKIKWKEATFVIREFKRASFVLKRSDHAEQMATIKEGITSLESLIDRNIKMESGRKQRSQGRLMRLVREVSGSVYRALRSSFQCSCAHEVHLGLAPRSTEMGPQDDDEDIIQKIHFQLGLTYHAEKGSGDTTQTQGRLSRDDVRVTAIRRQPRELHNLTANLQPSKVPLSPGYKRKSVAFALSQSSAGAAICTAQSTTTMVMQKSFSTLSIGSSNAEMEEHINLCKRIRRSQNQTTLHCYGVITDRTPKISRDFEVYPMKECDQEAWSIVSLRQVLEQPSDFPPMHFSDKLHLAATISSSFLQLHETPWLPEMLTSRDILFLKRGAGLRYENAFVMNSLPEGIRKPRSEGNSVPGTRSAALLSLGILLLELYLGKTIESLRPQQEEPSRGIPRLTLDSITAQTLLLRNEIQSPNYATAVQRCVSGGFERQKLDLNDEDFRQGIYDKVVSLLETDLNNATLSYNVGTC